MDPLHEYDECVKIENARCDLRAACQGKDAAFDKHFPDFDRDTCIAYAREHCRTREIQGQGWTKSDLNACVEAISDLAPSGCSRLDPAVDETESLEECAFIEQGEDAGEIDSESDDDAG